jgi:hypothetical protein
MIFSRLTWVLLRANLSFADFLSSVGGAKAANAWPSLDAGQELPRSTDIFWFFIDKPAYIEDTRPQATD